MTVLSLRLPEDINSKLEKISKLEERSKAFIIKKILAEHLSEYLKPKKTYTLKEAMAELGLTEQDIDPKKHDFSDCD